MTHTKPEIMNPILFQFLQQLKENNDREWFHANKGLYDKAKLEFESFINLLIPEIAKFDESVKFISAKDCIFRIFRDVRFAKDKSPYKTNFGAFISKGGRKSHGPGYYLHIEPGGCFLAGGVWMPEPDVMKKIRQEIYYNITEVKGILDDKSFRKYFKGIDEWDKQKLPPREFPKDFPDIDLLKNRSFTVSHPIADEQILREDLFDYLLRAYKVVLPYNQFLSRGMEG